MALEEMLKGDEPENLNDIEFEIDNDTATDTEDNDNMDVADDDEIDLLIDDDEEVSAEEDEPEPVKKAKDDGKVPRNVLVAERKKKQAEIDALKLQLEALKKASTAKRTIIDDSTADPVMVEIKNELQSMKFELFAKDVPTAAEHKEAIMQLASDKGLDFESAYYALVGKSQTQKTKEDLEREISARVEQELKKASLSGKISFSAGAGSQPAKGTGAALTPAQQQVVKIAGIAAKDYAKFSKNVSWDEGNKLIKK